MGGGGNVWTSSIPGVLHLDVHLPVCPVKLRLKHLTISSTLGGICGAEIEPGHVNASKYLRVTEQHMVQLGIPVFSSALPPVSSLQWNSQPYTSAEMSMATQPPPPQPPQGTGKPIPT